MSSLALWQEGPKPSPGPSAVVASEELARGLPAHVAEAVWRGTELGKVDARVVSSGFQVLDAELPGGGWPTRCLTELLLPQSAICEWRLLGPAVPSLLAEEGSTVYLVSPPKQPNAPGLAQLGVTPDRLVWIEVKGPAERLWVAEQLIKSDPCGAVMVWLPQARPEQLRRLQVHAQSCDAPVFVFRPETALRDTSAAPLRISVALGTGWNIDLRIRKRRGATFDGVLELLAMPGNLDIVIPPRLRKLPAPAPARQEMHHVLGSTAPNPVAAFRVAH
ncbi:MAG: translesion DNA synthesis-associated protein ImuA [Microcystis aeruginosa Ma_QC_Ch_20071001_M135]|nr:MAG: translesion DNA synthesis-associated protein ImuA [Microcystis aeruginosa Ma_QC_Ch_20071001_M135]